MGYNMEEIINVLMFCIWLGALILCCILVVSGVLRWLAPVDKRQKRLNFVSIIAFIILCVIFVIRNQTVFRSHLCAVRGRRGGPSVRK